MGNYRTYSSLVKLQPWFLSFSGRPAFGRTLAYIPPLLVKDLSLGRTLWWWYIFIQRRPCTIAMGRNRRRPQTDEGGFRWLSWRNDTREQMWPKFSDIYLTVDENPRKKTQPGNWPDRGSNQGPLGERQRRYPLTTVMVKLDTEKSSFI